MQIDRFFSVFKIAGRGMAMQRQQIEVSAENIANANTTRVAGTNAPYAPKSVVVHANNQNAFANTLTRTQLSLRTTNPEHIAIDEGAAQQVSAEALSPASQVVSEQKYRYEYDPSHPDADANGMVKYPDVDLVKEMTNMVSANRLYEANLSVVEAAKQVIKKSFQI